MCVPHWSCGYWSECKVRYNLSELVFKDNSQIILYGLREKSCYDLRNCVFPILKTKICKELIDVDILRTVDRGVSIYSIKDRNTGEIVVKIRKGLRDDLPFLDINL